MDKSVLIAKLKELTQTIYAFPEDIAINQAEIAILMQTFGITWDELEQHPSHFSLVFCPMILKEDDIWKEHQWLLKTHALAKEKGSIGTEYDTRLMLKGFVRGVKFFNRDLSFLWKRA